MRSHSPKFLFLSVFVVSSFLVSALPAQAGLILQRPNYVGLNQGLVGFWSFDGKDMSGTRALDRSGQGNNGTLTNGPIRTEGKLGQAVNFDGTNDYISIGGGSVDTPPSFIQEAETAWNSNTSPKTTASFNVLAGDVLVAFGVIEGYNPPGASGTLSVDGGSLIWTNQETIQLINYSWVAIWTATVDTNKSMTVSFTATGNDDGIWFGGNVLTFRGSSGVGAAEQANANNGGAPSLGVTTLQANSALVVASGDWNAADGTTRTWRTVNSITPAAGNGEVSYFRDSARYTVYGAYYSDAGATGAKTVGVSAPTGQKWSIAAVEVKGTTGGAGAVGNVNSVSFWARPNSLTQSIIDLDGTSNIDISGGTVRANNITGASIYIDGVQTTAFPDTGWHHVTVTASSAVNATAFNIGKISSSFFNGILDDVRVYNRALSADEIKRLYRIGATLHTNTQINNDSLLNGLVGYWSFDGPDMSGVKAFDGSAQGNVGTLTNGPTRNIGKLGQALEFDGSNDYVDFLTLRTGTGLDIIGNAVTISAWIKADTTSGTRRIASIPAIEAQGYEKYALLIGSNNLKFEIRADEIDTELQTAFTDTQNWHHVLGRYDGSTMKIYIDGDLKATDAKSGNIGQIAVGGTENFQIGRYGPSFGQYFDGKIDDVRVYNRALSADEIKRLYRIGATLHVNTQINNDSLKNGLVGWWSFDGKDMSGVKAHDRSGYGNDGTLTNGPTRTIGKLGQALEFDGVNDSLSTANSVAIGSAIATVSFWLWYDAFTVACCASVLELSSNPGANEGSFSIAPDDDTNPTNFVAWMTSGSYRQESIPSPSSKDWHHYVIVFDNSTTAGDIRIFLDGLEQSTTLDVNSKTTSGNLRTDVVYFMSRGEVSQFSKGKLDDVRIYNRALSSDEIKRLYQIGTGRAF